jgi:hypothetical protein
VTGRLDRGRLIASDQLSVADEIDVFQAVLAWGRATYGDLGEQAAPSHVTGAVGGEPEPEPETPAAAAAAARPPASPAAAAAAADARRQRLAAVGGGGGAGTPPRGDGMGAMTTTRASSLAEMLAPLFEHVRFPLIGGQALATQVCGANPSFLRDQM